MFVVYYVNSTMEVKRYKRRGDAQNQVAYRNLHAQTEYDRVAFAHITRYRKQVVYMVEKTNMMSGKKYMEPSNTPCYLSPSSETYWSM